MLGFPTTIRPGFWVFMILLAVLYPFPLGLWIAGAVAVFTVIHELGHALAARATGCSARISLDFMVAYAAYESRRPLSWRARAGIALAGPALQVTTAIIALLVAGANPWSRDDISSTDATMAIWWAGIVLGLLNLVPLIPLDGGSIVASLIDSVAPSKGRPIMVRVSFAITLFLIVVGLFTPFQSLVPFLGLLAFMQWQSLSLGGLSPNQMMQFAIEEWQSAPSVRAAVDNALLALTLEQTDWVFAWLHAARTVECDSGEVQMAIGDGKDFTPVWGDPRWSSLMQQLATTGR